MYAAWAKRRGWSFELLDVREGEPGIRQATVRVSGDAVNAIAQEVGVHAVQHITRSRRKDRIHTSTASIAAYPERMDPLRRLPMGEVRIDTFRGSGPGGQHRNVTDSGVRATHQPSGLTASVTSGRSQGINREKALAVLESRWLAQQTDVARERVEGVRRRQVAGASRSATSRVYDRVRDMVRTKDGRKVRGVAAILGGDLAPLWRD
jgi:peptide chain release factor 1